MVSTSFITRGPRSNVYRGLFANSSEWLFSQLDLIEIDCRRCLGLETYPKSLNDQHRGPEAN
jgi:hypothetical protein